VTEIGKVSQPSQTEAENSTYFIAELVCSAARRHPRHTEASLFNGA
jgi:hypothetical protein